MKTTKRSERQYTVIIPKNDIELVFLELTKSISRIADSGDKAEMKFLKLNLSPLMTVLWKMSVVLTGKGKTIIPNLRKNEVMAVAGFGRYAGLKIYGTKTWPDVFYLTLQK